MSKEEMDEHFYGSNGVNDVQLLIDSYYNAAIHNTTIEVAKG